MRPWPIARSRLLKSKAFPLLSLVGLIHCTWQGDIPSSFLLLPLSLFCLIYFLLSPSSFLSSSFAPSSQPSVFPAPYYSPTIPPGQLNLPPTLFLTPTDHRRLSTPISSLPSALRSLASFYLSLHIRSFLKSMSRADPPKSWTLRHSP